VYWVPASTVALAELLLLLSRVEACCGNGVGEGALEVDAWWKGGARVEEEGAVAAEGAVLLVWLTMEGEEEEECRRVWEADLRKA
jgi:hypothetical protein